MPLTMLQASAPASIYLVTGDDIEDTENFHDLGEVSWCEDGQFPNDILYVREDLIDDPNEDRTYEVYVGDEHFAGADDFGEAFHYASGYADDGEGDVTVYEVRRRAICFLTESDPQPQEELFQ